MREKWKCKIESRLRDFPLLKQFLNGSMSFCGVLNSVKTLTDMASQIIMYCSIFIL